jgi:hypothetical protein
MTKLENVKILPCPFCDSVSKIKETFSGDYNYNKKYYDNDT